jgi:hypothetical protein
MKIKNILVSALVLCLAVSCNNSERAKTEKSSIKSDTNERTIALASIVKNDACFETRMERWFVRFHQLQNEGLTMDKANQAAIASVVTEFKACDGKPAIHVAQDESIKE